mgnify:CR=1 FL=1
MASKYPPEQTSGQPETLLEFPCKFPVKVMGRSEDGFEALVTEIVLVHADLHGDEPITINASSSGSFISVTVTITALSKAQLDRIYQDLSDCERVLVAL